MKKYTVSKRESISNGSSYIDIDVPVAEFYSGEELQVFMEAVDNSKYEINEEEDCAFYGWEKK